MQAIKDNKSAVRLSEQEALDCIPEYNSCDGGWMDAYYKMSERIGSQSEIDYPYEAAANPLCRNQEGKKIISRATYYENMYEVPEMKKAILNGPVSIAVAAGNDCWRYYESGVLTAANNCPT